MTEAKIVNDTYRLSKWYGLLLAKFPRNHRYGLGLRIESTIYDIMELFISANHEPNRKGILISANVKLEVLRFLVRLIYDLQLITEKQHHAFIEQVDTIGKQAGGWIKAS